MNLHCLSDLHLEHLSGMDRAKFFNRLRQQLKADPVDTVVLAGDVGSVYSLGDLQEFLLEFSAMYKDVIYVAGNHEFFARSIVEGSTALAEAIRDLNSDRSLKGEIHFLNPGDRVTIEGKVFAGGTGWYPDCGDKYKKKNWIDYNRIEDCDPVAHNLNAMFMEKNFGGVDVMVSHMLPTEEAVGLRWRSSWTNLFFTMGIEDRLMAIPKDKLPKLWFFGHTHDPKDYLSRFGFRAYCNPLAYPHEGTNPEFWDRLVVKV